MGPMVQPSDQALFSIVLREEEERELNKLTLENSMGTRYVDNWIGVDIDIVKMRIFLEELIPKRRKVEVGVGKEEKSDLALWIRAGREVRKSRRIVVIDAVNGRT
uniref:Uncharacterized protein n=1 Tax=Cannabis sativa TaxID=3483 RepID=A0A803NR95_CANSA